jgi:hypothetical protein
MRADNVVSKPPNRDITPPKLAHVASVLTTSNYSFYRHTTGTDNGFLSRHKRTHDRGDGAEGTFNLSGEDEEEYSGEDQLGSLEEASPGSENAYVTASLNSVANGSTPTSMPPAQAYNSLQTLSMPMTISQPTAVNASALMG